jgi:hypothetical protein
MNTCVGLASFVSILVVSLSAIAGDPVVIAKATSPNHPQQPQLCIDREGVIHLVFGAHNDVRYCRSEDGGKTFTEPVNLPRYRVMALGMRRGPRVAVSGDSICVSVIGGVQGKGDKGNLLAFRSSDNGKTWQGPVVVNEVTESAREGLHAMAASPKGQLACVWLDLRNKRTEIMASFSDDGGKTWGENVLAYQSPDGSVCECCHPSVTYDAEGTVHAMWRNQLGGARDIYITSSTDGTSFGKAKKLGAGTWPIDHCPMDGGSIAALPAGGIAAAWRRDTNVYFVSAQGNKEQLLGPGEQPWVAANDVGAFTVWVTKRGGPLLLLAPKHAKPAQLAASAGDPCIAAETSKNGIVIVAWEDGHGKESKIVCQVVRDQGKSTRK